MTDTTTVAPESSPGASSAAPDAGYLQEHTGATGATPTPDAKPPESSPGEGAKPDELKSPLDVVKSAMEANKAAESPAADPQDPDAGKPDAKAKAEEEGKPDDGKEDLPPFHTHPRWKEITAENDRLRRQTEEYQAKMQPLEEESTRYRAINQFLIENNLGAEDFKNGLNIMQLMRNDPAAAYEALTPYYNALSRMIGMELPPDIQQKLDDGLIDQETALLLSTERAQKNILQTRMQEIDRRNSQMAQQSEQDRLDENRRKFVDSLVSAVQKWEDDWSKSDPDYDKLMPLVRARAAELTQVQPPKNPEEAVKMAEKAKASIKEEMRKFAPARTSVQPVTGGINSGTQPHPQPNSGLDVVRNALSG